MSTPPHLLTDPAGIFNGDQCSGLSLLISFKSDEVKSNQQKKTCLKYNSSERLNGGKLRFSHCVCEGNLYSQPAEAWASRRDHSDKLSERGAVACWGMDINSRVFTRMPLPHHPSLSVIRSPQSSVWWAAHLSRLCRQVKTEATVECAYGLSGAADQRAR